MESLPQEVRIPANLIHKSKVTNFTAYVEGTLRDVAEMYSVRVIEDSGLGFPSLLSFELAIGNVMAAIDYNELPQLPPRASEYDVWLKLQTTSGHTPIGNVLAFPPPSFSDWKQYRMLRRDITYLGRGPKILYSQCTQSQVYAQQWAADLTRRRSLVREILAARYGDDLDTDFTDQLRYWKRWSQCLVSVHVPGLWANMLSRSQLQAFAFGVCTVSPVLHTYLGDYPPVPGVHYVACRDDFSDLIEKIEWCRANREECISIGSNAKRLFEATATPEAAWRRVGSHLLNVLPTKV